MSISHPLPIFVAGPTASGKTDLALDLAERLDGEIVNADSRQCYRGMDIGTAKPTPAEQARVPHWLVDVADPDEPLGLAWFLDRAHEALAGIRARGRAPIVCGGTGQYVRALLEGWAVPRVPPDADLRATLARRIEGEGLPALFAELSARDPALAARTDPRNARRVIRAFEVLAAPAGSSGLAHPPLTDAALFAIAWPRAAIYERIDRRVEAMVAAGFVDEVRALNARGYGCDLPSFSAIGYREICDHLRGERTLDAAVERIKFATHRLARTQANWFRADDPRITWLDPGPDLAGRALASLAAMHVTRETETRCSS